MLECISLFDQALVHLQTFLDDDDEDRLKEAMQLAEEASDVLSLIEDAVQTHKDILNEMVEA